MAGDSYERTTQLLPAFAALAPLSFLLLTTFRTNDTSDLIRSLVALVLAGGLHLILMRIVRDRGNRAQQRLWRSWGGSTTVQKLRWSAGSEADIRDLHSRVQRTSGVKLPSRRAEERDQASADAIYERAIRVLREQTRDHEKYPRVWAELKHYGSARNLFALRPTALSISLIVTVASAGLFWASVHWTWEIGWWPFAVSGSFALLDAVVWLVVVTPRFVKLASERYSDALLHSAGA